MRQLLRYSIYLVSALLAIALGHRVGSTIVGSRTSMDIASTGRASFPIQSGRQLVFVFIGSSTCVASHNDEFLRGLRAAKANAKKWATDNGFQFWSIGASIDSDHIISKKYLEKAGPFNEVVLGGEWLNLGAFEYFWGSFAGKPALPTVVVLSRELIVDDDVVRRTSMDLVGRFVGIGEVSRLNHPDLEKILKLPVHQEPLIPASH